MVALNTDRQGGAYKHPMDKKGVEGAHFGVAAARSLSESIVPLLSDLPVYALVDPFFREPLLADVNTNGVDSFEKLRTAREDGWDREVAVAMGADPLIDPLRLPYIVTLKGADDPLLPSLIEQAQVEAREALEADVGVFTLGSLIQTELTPQALITRLESMWTFQVQGADRYLRLADPRVFEMLAHLCSANDLRNYLGPIARWHVRTRNGVWAAFAGKADELETAAEEAQFRRAAFLAECAGISPRLPSHQLAPKLLHSEAISRSLTRLQRAFADSDSRITSDTYQAAWQARANAQAAGLQHIDDVVAYIWHSLVDPGIFKSPPALHALAASRKMAGTLEQNLSMLDLPASGAPNVG